MLYTEKITQLQQYNNKGGKQGRNNYWCSGWLSTWKSLKHWHLKPDCKKNSNINFKKNVIEKCKKENDIIIYERGNAGLPTIIHRQVQIEQSNVFPIAIKKIGNVNYNIKRIFYKLRILMAIVQLLLHATRNDIYNIID